jgi:integrase
MLVAQRATVSKVEHQAGIVCPLVFPRLNGGAIKSLRGAWNAAAERSGLDASLIHDLRRSAAKRYSAAGVSRATAMALAGWKTEEIFNRYNIVSPDDLEAGLAKVAKHRGSASAAKRVSHAIRPRSGPVSSKKAV